MQILVDENIPLSSVESLQNLGHEVIDIRGTDKEGGDDELWKIVQNHSALLITTDKGFTKRRNDSHFGILVIRLKQPNSNKIHQKIIDTVSSFPEKEWPNTLIVVRDEVKSIWSNE